MTEWEVRMLLTSLLGGCIFFWTDISTRVWFQVIPQVFLVPLDNMRQENKVYIGIVIILPYLMTIDWLKQEYISIMIIVPYPMMIDWWIQQTLVITQTSTLLPLPKSLKIPEHIASVTSLTPSSLCNKRTNKVEKRSKHLWAIGKIIYNFTESKVISYAKARPKKCRKL